MTPAPTPTYPETLSPTEKTFPGVCAGGDDESIMMDPRLTTSTFATPELDAEKSSNASRVHGNLGRPFGPRVWCRRARASGSHHPRRPSVWCCMVLRGSRSRPAVALHLGETDSMPKLRASYTGSLTSPAPTASSAPTRQPAAEAAEGLAFPGICADADVTALPKSVGSDRTLPGCGGVGPFWAPSLRLTRSSSFGALARVSFGNEVELLIEKPNAGALGVFFHGPSKLVFSVDAGIYLGRTSETPPLCSRMAPTAMPTTAAPMPKPTPPPSPMPTSAPTKRPLPVTDASAERFSNCTTDRATVGSANRPSDG